jgi:hypothetical protein
MEKNFLEAIENLIDEEFDHHLNSISIIAVLSQLFIVEQDYNYEGESNYEPPTLFYQAGLGNLLIVQKKLTI